MKDTMDIYRQGYDAGKRAEHEANTEKAMELVEQLAMQFDIGCISDMSEIIDVICEKFEITV